MKRENPMMGREKTLALLIISFIFQACSGITDVDPSNAGKRALSTALAGTNQAYVYLDNPSILDGAFVYHADFEGKVSPQLITTNSLLQSTCLFTQYYPDSLSSTDLISYSAETDSNCMSTLQDMSTSTQMIQSTNQSWVFSLDSDEFYQVNTYYHINTMTQRFLESLSFAHKYVHLQSPRTIPPATKYNLRDTGTYWLTRDGVNQNLKSYAYCYNEMNAYYSPSEDLLCFGYYAEEDDDDDDTDEEIYFRMVQDPTIIYHELGHAFVKIMMNQRNVTSGTDPDTYDAVFDSHPYQSDLGELYYDEAGAINEAIADWFSYYMNNRTSLGEFALTSITHYSGSAYGNYRPLSEDEDAHAAGISTEEGERLSYPAYLHYDPAEPTTAIEDIHYASAIASHYFVALTKELENSCTFTTDDEDEIHEIAGDYMVMLLSETMAEIGDLTAKGSDFFSSFATLNSSYRNVYFTNLNEDQSFLWTQHVNPPNYRRFFRILGKNIFHYISSDLCPEFTIDESEKLLDDYGLLLFRSYEDRGVGYNTDTYSDEIYASYFGNSLFSDRTFLPYAVNTEVNEDNRRYSVLIDKDYIELDEDTIGYVVDGQTDITNILATLTYQGANVQTSEGLAGTEYNNNHTDISPGEIVALSLNLRNTSNSTMGGVQFLGNDWDHMKLSNQTNTFVSRTINKQALKNGDITTGLANFKPCTFDGFPSTSAGGEKDTTTTSGSCGHANNTNLGLILADTDSDGNILPRYDLDAPQPICFVQYSDDDETLWVNQDYFRQVSMNLEDSQCLNNPSMSGNNFNPNECLIRTLPGANQANLGMIEAQSTWAETLSNGGGSLQFTAGQMILIEVNKNVPAGTTFNCRFRTRFTNCSDCWEDENGDPYPDYMYTGHEPFKLINFQFTVLD